MLSKRDSLCIKGIATLFLLFHHLFYSKDIFKEEVISSRIFDIGFINTMALFGKVCLCLFIFISGYGISETIKKSDGNEVCKSTRKRFINLFKKFVFIFLIVNILSIFFISKSNRTLLFYFSNTDSNVFNGVIYFLLDMFCLSEIFGTPMLNSTWWYMPTAFLVILLTPVIYDLTKKYKSSIFFISFLAPIILLGNVKMTITFKLLPVLCLGIYCSESCLISRIENSIKKILKSKQLILICAVLLFFIIFYMRSYVELSYLIDPLFALFICIFVRIFINDDCNFMSSSIYKLLSIFGTYSTMIFLTHTFIKAYWFKKFTYCFENYFIIFVVFCITSLLFAIFLTKLYTRTMKIFHYKKIK